MVARHSAISTVSENLHITKCAGSQADLQQHYRTTPWVKKGCHPNHGYNFVNSWWICKILLLLQRAVNFQQNYY